MRSQSEGSSVSRLRFRTLVPALQTRTSIVSNAAVTSLTAAFTATLSAMSQVATMAVSRPLFNCCPRPLELLAIAADEGDPKAHFGQRGGDAAADSTAGPRDEGSLQSRGQGSLLSWDGRRSSGPRARSTRLPVVEGLDRVIVRHGGMRRDTLAAGLLTPRARAAHPKKETAATIFRSPRLVCWNAGWSRLRWFFKKSWSGVPDLNLATLEGRGCRGACRPRGHRLEKLLEGDFIESG